MLWEGRYKACLVDSEHYVLACYRYIELNPVLARLTDDPAAWRWSSCTANLGLRPRSRLAPHPAWQALGATDADRSTAYGRLYLQQQRAWGRDDFRAMVEAKTHRFAGTRPAHRPCKPTAPDK
jgi:putative transposase